MPLKNSYGMSSSLLKHNKVITPRPGRRGLALNYYKFDSSERFRDGKTISGNIRMYHMWFRFLKLTLELEELEIPVRKQKIKVDRRFYRRWDLDEVLVSSFTPWWHSHKHLFVEPSVERLTSSEKHDRKFVYLKISKSKTQTDALREIKHILEGQLTGRQVEFPFSGRIVPYIRLYMQYDCLVMSLNGKSRLEIMNWCNKHFANIAGVIQDKKDASGNKIEEVFGYEQSVSRVLSKARNTVCSCARGIFP